ncbi:FAD-binding domain-containing protein [Phellopilus nigrolimitatus]|nr:FAD-binding domain-containing protein [Phellopilus nigrolimitatus]
MVRAAQFLVSVGLAFLGRTEASGSVCRNLPGDPAFPSQVQWDQLSSQVGGRLLSVVPSAQFCHELPSGNCTEDQWTSATFRATIPGAVDVMPSSIDYKFWLMPRRIIPSHPPSLCLQNGTTCGQGDVPVYAINVSSIADIQAGVKFAAQHNLRVVIKASGHDFQGRSTAKGALLLWTHYMRNITFTDSFLVGGNDVGAAVTVGSGVPLNMIYTASKAVNQIFVGGTAANVVAAGGFGQGAGHSAYSPLFGLAADNALVFWALRGGGAGSWGVIVSATFRTFPTFEATMHTTNIMAPTSEIGGKVAELHAQHIFDWDDVRAGQYFYFFSGASRGFPGSVLNLRTYFANYTEEQAVAAMKPLLDDARAMNLTVGPETTTTAIANDLVFVADDPIGFDAVLGSRLIPAKAYRNNASGIGDIYKFLLDEPIDQIGGHLVAGGKVAENSQLPVAVTPKWRTAKAHVSFLSSLAWSGRTVLPIAQIEQAKNNVTYRWVPALVAMTGELDSGSYSNEANVREPDFQTTFYGPNYERLSAIKRKYDPNDLFIVGAGVGSERWDDKGVCRRPIN